MAYAPRTIAFVTELIHPPLNPNPAIVQRVHNDLIQSADPAYKSFAVTPAGAVLSNPVTRPGAVSSASFMADRFQFREELGSMTVDEFAALVREISERVASLAGIQVFTAQQVTINTLVNPKRYADAREFLKEGMFGFSDETEDFGRVPQLFGLRLIFPPSEDAPNAYALRIESFNDDSRSLFVENQASYPPILVARGPETLEQNIQSAYAFLVDRALSFVSRFDQRQDEGQQH
jgi:hypothetical protein